MQRAAGGSSDYLFCVFKQWHQEEGEPVNVIFSVVYHGFIFSFFLQNFKITQAQETLLKCEYYRPETFVIDSCFSNKDTEKNHKGVCPTYKTEESVLLNLGA